MVCGCVLPFACCDCEAEPVSFALVARIGFQKQEIGQKRQAPNDRRIRRYGFGARAVPRKQLAEKTKVTQRIKPILSGGLLALGR
jgi:hypothetical protein